MLLAWENYQAPGTPEIKSKEFRTVYIKKKCGLQKCK